MMSTKGKRSFILPSLKIPMRGMRQRHKSEVHVNVIQRISHKVLRRHQRENPPTSEALDDVVKTIGLSQKQVFKLYRKFKGISKTGSHIAREDLYSALDEKESDLSQSLFKMMDVKTIIHFEDFVRISSAWSLFSKEDILKFCFDRFDADASGFIDENEFKMLTLSVGSPIFPGNFDAAIQIQMVDENGDGVIDFAEFKILDKRFPLILFPAFRLQEKFQKITLGERDWIDISRRVQLARNIVHHQAKRSHHDGRWSLPGVTKLPPINLDPVRIDALKRGQSLNGRR